MELENNHKIRLGEKLGFMGFSTATNIAFNFKSLYYLFFLDTVCGLGVDLAGIVLAIGTVWDAVNDPLIALICTNHRFKNGEKVRPWALWACVPWALSIVLMFTNFGFTSKTITMVVCLAIYFVFEALYTFLCMPYNSMAALATKDDSERASINAFRGLGGCLGSGIGAVAIPSLIKLCGGLKESKTISVADTPAIFAVACIMGVLCIGGSLLHYFTTKERIKPEEDDNEVKLSFFEAYKRLFRCRSWVLNMCYIIGYAVIQAFLMQNVNYYAAYVFGDSNLATPILACYLVVAIIISIFGPALDKKIGRKWMTLIAIFVMIAGSIPFIFAPRLLVSICILAVAMGYGATVTFIIFNTNRNNISDVLEAQNDQRMDTLVAGGDNLITKLSEAGAILIMTQIYDNFGMDKALATNQPEGVYNAMFFFLGIGVVIVALVMLIFAFKINIPKELAEAKAAQVERKSK